MPEKASDSGFLKCASCASLNALGLGPLPTVSHGQICCLFKITSRTYGGLFDEAVSYKRCENESLCDGCPSGRKFQRELEVDALYRPSLSSSDGLQEGASSKPAVMSDGMHKTSEALAVTQSTFLELEDSVGFAPTCCEAGREVAESLSSRKRKKRVTPRLRRGFSNYTLEWRPPRFKQKIWLGTYSQEEIDRATDGVNYYLRHGEPFLLPDSARIFAERPLKGIKLEDISPSCDQKINGISAHTVFARQVKTVIHSVLCDEKSSSSRKSAWKGKELTLKKESSSSENLACRESNCPQSLHNAIPKKLIVSDPIVPPAPGSTTSADTQFMSCRPSPETSPLLAAPISTVLSPDIMTLENDEETMRWYTQTQSEELLSSGWSSPLDEMFASYGPIFTSDYGESSKMEWNNHSPDLWESFQNEDPSFFFR